MTGPELVLRGPEVAQVAAALELALRTRRRNGHAPGGELRQVAAKVALAVPLVAACLPALLDAAGPEAAAIVRAQVNGTDRKHGGHAPGAAGILGRSPPGRCKRPGGTGRLRQRAAGSDEEQDHG